MDLRRGLKYAGAALGVLVALVLLGFLLGVFGVPEVAEVNNEFGAVNNSTTEIKTELVVENPNPFGVSLGGLTIDYTVNMSGVRMAEGQKEGLSVGAGNSTVELTTYLDNSQIPAWWYNHIDSGEQSEVVIDATASDDTFGETELQETETVQTDILSSFNSTETRPINASSPVVSDPALYMNQTNASFGENLTRQRTPLNMTFQLYNPKSYPYVVTRIGYTISMNNVTVGEGVTDRNQVIGPRPNTETITARTAIDNGNLDDWWVTHIRNNQVTNLHVDIYVVVKPDRGTGLDSTEGIRLDSDEFDYRETIETDIFGSKNNSSNGGTQSTPEQAPTEDGSTDGDDTPTSDETTTDDGTSGDQTGEAETTEDDDLLN